MLQSSGAAHSADHNPVLEHSLHQLLREIHHRNGFQVMPHPVTSMMGASKRRKLAGPLGYTREQLQEPAGSKSVQQTLKKTTLVTFVHRRRVAAAAILAALSTTAINSSFLFLSTGQ